MLAALRDVLCDGRDAVSQEARLEEVATVVVPERRVGLDRAAQVPRHRQQVLPVDRVALVKLPHLLVPHGRRAGPLGLVFGVAVAGEQDRLALALRGPTRAIGGDTLPPHPRRAQPPLPALQGWEEGRRHVVEAHPQLAAVARPRRARRELAAAREAALDVDDRHEVEDAAPAPYSSVAPVADLRRGGPRRLRIHQRAVAGDGDEGGLRGGRFFLVPDQRRELFVRLLLALWPEHRQWHVRRRVVTVQHHRQALLDEVLLVLEPRGQRPRVDTYVGGQRWWRARRGGHHGYRRA